MREMKVVQHVYPVFVIIKKMKARAARCALLKI